MPKDGKMLNIVDEQGNILGEATREQIHKHGLLHREIHVWFYTSDGKIIFQHRAKDKDTNPDQLDATVGGHVEIGSDYLASALKEIQEETGLNIKSTNLTFLKIIRSKFFDPITNTINNVLRAIYAYRYDKNIQELKIETDKSLGFESWPLDKLFSIRSEDKQHFIPSIFAPKTLDIFRKIQKL